MLRNFSKPGSGRTKNKIKRPTSTKRYKDYLLKNPPLDIEKLRGEVIKKENQE